MTMKLGLNLALAAIILILLETGCHGLGLQTPTPLPGWSGNVRELFVEESAFPAGWEAQLYLETDVHPSANHVHREFFGLPIPGTGMVSQDIWRAYTIEDAKAKYTELRASQFQPRLPADSIILQWEPPPEINFQSSVSDEFYLACGWEEWSYCQVVARYSNYVTYLRLDREATLGEHHSDGLTYSEIEDVIKAMDIKFEMVLTSFSTPLPR
jgi:hypothetical protein